MTYYTLPKNSNAIEGGRVAEKPHKKLMGKDIQKNHQSNEGWKKYDTFCPERERGQGKIVICR